MSDHLHIVCLDAPSPPDYGGAIDMYYKIIALASIGKKISLHYFQYKKGRHAGDLEKYCTRIYTYPRAGFAASLFSATPYLVRARTNKELIEQLNGDEDPVLLEGLHCSGVLPFLQKPERAIVRMHNEEEAYYARLAPTEKNFIKKTYLYYESFLLKRYYKQLPANTPLACLSQTDIEVLSNKYGFTNVHFIPCFIPWQELSAATGRGAYCLYHGNLSVPENEAAAAWLVRRVWDGLDIPLVIAGKGASEALKKLCKSSTHIRLENDPTLQRIDDLVAGAQVHVLPSFNSTGVKLKLLHALFRGRFCIANTAGVQGSAIHHGVSTAETPEQWKTLVTELFHRPFTEEDKKNRQPLLPVYDNKLNAEKLSALWSRYR